MRNAVSYTREQRQIAKEEGLELVCASAMGIEFSGPVPKEMARKFVRWITKHLIIELNEDKKRKRATANNSNRPVRTRPKRRRA